MHFGPVFVTSRIPDSHRLMGLFWRRIIPPVWAIYPKFDETFMCHICQTLCQTLKMGVILSFSFMTHMFFYNL